MKLGVYDTNRLMELVSIYLKPSESGITIYKNGEVCLRDIGFLKKALNMRAEGTIDFLDVVKRISESLINEKGNSNQVQSICGEALGTLIDSNDRKKVIELLYSAHLIDANKKQQRQGQNNNGKRPQSISVEVIDQVRPKNLTTFRQEGLNSRNGHLADLLNSADEVIIVE